MIDVYKLIRHDIGYSRRHKAPKLSNDEIDALLYFWQSFPETFTTQEYFHSEFAFGKQLKIAVGEKGRIQEIPLDYKYSPNQKKEARSLMSVAGPVTGFSAEIPIDVFKPKSKSGRYYATFVDDKKRSINIVCDLFTFPHKTQLSTEYFSIYELHRNCENLIAIEMERRGIDCVAFRHSGWICRRVTIDNVVCPNGKPIASKFVLKTEKMINISCSPWPNSINNQLAQKLDQWPDWWNAIDRSENDIATLQSKLIASEPQRTLVSANKKKYIHALSHSDPNVRDLALELNNASDNSKESRNINQIARDFSDNGMQILAVIRTWERRKSSSKSVG